MVVKSAEPLVDIKSAFLDLRQRAPESWKESKETPTIYSIKLHSGEEKLVMISGCPAWKEGEQDLSST